jgi:hypothetical protein
MEMLSWRTLFVLGLSVGTSAQLFSESSGQVPFALRMSTDDITAVASRTSPDYVRTKLGDGTFKPESYVFGKGGTWSGSMEDLSMDKVTFLDLAHTLAFPLADRNYLPGKDPHTTKLLIMVYWGTTRPPLKAKDSVLYSTLGVAIRTMTNDAVQQYADEGANRKREVELKDEISTDLISVEMENDQREKDDARNSDILGYDSWWSQTQQYENKGFGMDYARQDMLTELEEDRYFVVLMAYDFQLMAREKKHKLLWETRFSVRQLHHDFAKDLPAMAQYASKYFGQDTNGLVHGSVPFGHVEIGETKSLGEVEAPKK